MDLHTASAMDQSSSSPFDLDRGLQTQADVSRVSFNSSTNTTFATLSTPILTNVSISQDPGNPQTSDLYKGLEAYALGYWHVHPYLSLLICVFGIASNIINILILTQKKMLNPINCVLTGIAASDILTMADYIPFVIHFYLRTGIEDRVTRYTYFWSHYLAVHSCLSNTTHTISMWLAVCMSAMRYVFIRTRGNSRWNLSVNRTIVIIILVYVTSVIVFIPNYLVTKVKPIVMSHLNNATIYKLENLQIYLKDSSTVNIVNVWLFILLGKLLPCMFMCLFGGLLLRTLGESKKLSKTLKQTSCSQRMRAHKRTTTLLLAIVLMFIVAELPSAILVFVSLFVERFFLDYYLLFADTLDILSLINNAVNFIMYCSMSRQFRECLCESVPCLDDLNKRQYQLANGAKSHTHVTQL